MEPMRTLCLSVILAVCLCLSAGCTQRTQPNGEPDPLPEPEPAELVGAVHLEMVEITEGGIRIQTRHTEYANALIPLEILARFTGEVRAERIEADGARIRLGTRTIRIWAGTPRYEADGETRMAQGPSFAETGGIWLHASLLAAELDGCRWDEQEGLVVDEAAGGVEEMVTLSDTEGAFGFQTLISARHPLDAQDTGRDLVVLNREYPDFHYLRDGMEFNDRAARALSEMLRAAQADTLDGIWLVSTYRTYAYQEVIFERKVREYMRDFGYGEEEARREAARVVALPGGSEHQSGLAVDFTSADMIRRGEYLTVSFRETPEGIWLARHAPSFGFILRYPAGTEELTGIREEPWHYRYVGVPHAGVMQEKNLVLEDYLVWLAREGALDVHQDGREYRIVYVEDSLADRVRVDTGISEISPTNEGGYILTIVR